MNTEDKFRLILGIKRSVLHTLHLDLPRGRDWSYLKSYSQSNNFEIQPRSSHIDKAFMRNLVYFDLLSDLIEYAFTKFTNPKIEVLKMFLSLKDLDECLFRALPAYFVDYFVECMEFESTDSEYVINCFKKLNFDSWLLYTEKPESVEKLLFQLNQVDKDIELDFCSSTFKERCFRRFQFIGAVLKTQDAPALGGTLCFYIAREVGTIFGRRFRNYHPHVLHTIQIILFHKPRGRCTLSWHLLWCYLEKASEAVRLVWECTNESHFTFQEIASDFGALGPEEIVSIYEFYSGAIGALEFPRSLQHFCKTTIRKRLRENNEWIPDGIKKIGLSQKIHSYLMLEKPAKRPRLS